MPTMKVMGDVSRLKAIEPDREWVSGDTKIIWDADNKVEVKAAKDTFDKLRKEGYSAYAVKRDGEPGWVVTKFDPDAEKLILAPRIAGG